MAALSRITFGAAFANTLEIGYPIDNAVAYPLPQEGSEWAQFNTQEDAWITGTDQILEFDVRWIPIVTTTDPVATGWDTATVGWAAFLASARDKNVFRFIPDRASPGTYFTCYLVEPLRGAPRSEDDGTRTLHLVLRNSAGTAFTGF